MYVQSVCKRLSALSFTETNWYTLPRAEEKHT